ncbi:hypothetical protein BKA70DRAFT_1423507 [Coprinopsis sp. MPI-PUGE-AT-0042]|nr:hypothetical protein BKA70DRAFT_1423507 [Coprinopsis sp. MPI-PUGE-AT-0042]
MPKAPSSPTTNKLPPKRPKRGKKQEPTAPGEVAELVNICDKNVKEFGKAAKTRAAYRGHLTRGQRFLENLVKERVNKKVDDGIDTSLLGQAFNGAPNRYSAFALQLFLGHKCFAENLSKSTAEGIHGAFNSFWDEVEGGQYKAPYTLDEESGSVKGNPAKAPCVSNVMKAIKTRVGRKGEAAYRDHAEAMSIEDMDRLMAWSLLKCPPDWLLNPPTDVALLKVTAEHGFIRGYASGAFTLFGRNNEMLDLRVGDVRLDCVSPDGKPFTFVVLSERKGWQKKASGDSDCSQGFELYDRPDEPSINAHRHIGPFMAFIELRIGRKLKPDEYVFPYIAPNGVVHPDRPCSYTFISDLLTKFTQGASINHSYTTHCFRRGGAQYRFQYAPEEKRWDLSTVQWWGDWAVGEDGVDTLIKYLVNSLHHQENSHQGAMHPDRVRKSGRAERVEGCTATREDLLDFKASVSRDIAADFSNFRAWLPTVLESFATASGASIKISPSQLSFISASQLSVATSASQILPASSSTAVQSVPEPTPSPPIHDDTEHQAAHCSNASTEAPLPGLVIPNLPKGGEAWKVAVRQWEQGGGNLTVPLRDWPRPWYTGAMKNTFGVKRGQRQLIFEAYERCGRDDAEFVRRYPGASKGIHILLAELRRVLPAGERRVSKNGSPEERDSI